MSRAILLISCPDQKGITATVTNFIYQRNGNIVHADQHIDEQSDTFFMRVEWELEGFNLGPAQIAARFGEIAGPFGMSWELFFIEALPKVAVFVSRQTHCLYDLLLRHRSGQLDCRIPLIISNHPDARDIAREFAIPYHEFAVVAQNKCAQEKAQQTLIRENGIDLIVLARYHQILTPEFVESYPNRIINIHHSFLPAFPGKNPYARAYEKGVKIIGATSHYVTAELDEGPIIEQDTVRVSHRDSLEDLVRKGQDLERVVLSRAVRWHLQRKILSYGNKTVVFD